VLDAPAVERPDRLELVERDRHPAAPGFGDTSREGKDLVREVMPFLWVMIGALALMTFIPEIVLFLPRLLGYKG